MMHRANPLFRQIVSGPEVNARESKMNSSNAALSEF